MKNLTKRFIATMLVLMMVVTLLPTFASAEGTADWSEYISISHSEDGVGRHYDIAVIVKADDTVLASGIYNVGYGYNNAMEISLNSDWQSVYKLSIDSISVEDALFYGKWLSDDATRIKGTYYTLNPDLTGWFDYEPSLVISLTYDHPEHDFKEVSRTNATCTTDGIINYACICGETESKSIPALGHDIDYTETYLSASVAADCENPGSSTYKCSRCDYTEIVTIPALGHEWGKAVHVEGTEKTEAQHIPVCTRDESHKGAAEACTFVKDTAKSVEPQETVDGKYVWVCSACGYTYEETVPATKNRYTVTYDANGGTDVPEAETVFEQEAYSLSTTVPKHAAENGVAVAFIGWSETQDAKLYTKDDTAPACVSSIKVDGNKTVYAVWGLDSNGDGQADVTEAAYTLTYEANGGDANVPAVAKYLSGEKVTLDVNKPTHADADGKKVVFAGWTAEPVSGILSKGDTAPEYLTEVTFADADITVYAAWGYDENGDGQADVNEETYTLTYDANGGTEAPEAVSGLLAQKDYILSTQAPKHDAVDGKAVVFIGWTAEKDSKIYAKGETLPAAITKTNIEGDTTVYAVYGYDEDGNGKPDVTETYVTLTYAANGGEGAPASETKALSDGSAAFTVSSTAPTRSEYTFKGWSTAADGKVQYQAGDKLTLTENTTLYAVWELNPLVKYTITYNANGGKDAPAAQSVESRTGSGVLVLSKDVPTREGYIFCGWSQVTSGYAQFQPGDRVEIKGDVTLYALWVDKASIPKTGDESNLALWAALAALSVIGMGAAIIIGKKQKEN